MPRSLLGLKRKMVLPSTLVAEFEKIAKRNTDRPPYGIETCGILAGKLVSGACWGGGGGDPPEWSGSGGHLRAQA